MCSNKLSKKPTKRVSRIIRIVKTKYSLRVLVQQGENRVWLRDRDLALLFQALLNRIFSEESE